MGTGPTGCLAWDLPRTRRIETHIGRHFSHKHFIHQWRPIITEALGLIHIEGLLHEAHHDPAITAPRISHFNEAMHIGDGAFKTQADSDLMKGVCLMRIE